MTPPNRPTTEEIADNICSSLSLFDSKGKPQIEVSTAIRVALDNLAAEKDEIINKLRGYLEDPPPSVQELVIQKLNLVSVDSLKELQASLSLAVGALKEAKETLIISERDTPLFIGQVVIRNSLKYIDESLSSPAIQKEVQKIATMERVVEAAIEQSKCHSNHAQDDKLREAIKAYEEINSKEKLS